MSSRRWCTSRRRGSTSLVWTVPLTVTEISMDPSPRRAATLRTTPHQPPRPVGNVKAATMRRARPLLRDEAAEARAAKVQRTAREPAMATRPGQVVRPGHVAEERPGGRASRMLVSGLTRATCLTQPVWAASGTLPVDRNVVKKMPDLQDRPGPLVRHPEHEPERPAGGDRWPPPCRRSTGTGGRACPPGRSAPSDQAEPEHHGDGDGGSERRSASTGPTSSASREPGARRSRS